MNPSGKVFVGIPAAGPPTWGLLDSLMRLVAPTGAFTYQTVKGLGVDLARNLLVKQFMETKCEWLLFLDSDAFVAPMTLMRLLQSEREVVGALCFTGSKPTTPTVFDVWSGHLQVRIAVEETREWIEKHEELHCNGPMVMREQPADAVVEVAATGCHTLLVHRMVLDVMEEPWFLSNPKAGSGRGEDLYFCHKAQETGFRTYVDRSVVSGHMVGNVCVGCLDFLAWDSFVDWQERRARIGES